MLHKQEENLNDGEHEIFFFAFQISNSRALSEPVRNI